jgi:septum formation inhibitor MinC
MEDLLIKAHLCHIEAENAMVASNFLAVAEKYRQVSQLYSGAAQIASSTANRLQLEGFSQAYLRKAQEAEDYVNQSASSVFEYGSLGTSEDSDSEETSSGATMPSDSPVVVRKQTPSLEVMPMKRRSGSLASKPHSLEEYAYAAQLEKHMSTSPLQALAAGFQTVREMVLGPKNLSTPPPRSPSSHPHPSSLGESFFMIADTTSEVNEREQRLQEELARVQGEFQKIQLLLDQVMQDQPKKPSSTPSSRRHASSHAMPATAIAREAHLKQSLRENYLAGSDVHLSKTELETEIKKLREQLTAAERRNSEWAAKWDQVKQKAMKKRDSRTYASTASLSTLSRPDSDSPSPSSHLLSSTPNHFH